MHHPSSSEEEDEAGGLLQILQSAVGIGAGAAMAVVILLFIGTAIWRKRTKRKENVVPVWGGGRKSRNSLKELDDDWNLGPVSFQNSAAKPGIPFNFQALKAPPPAPQPEEKSSQSNQFLKPDDFELSSVEFQTPNANAGIPFQLKAAVPLKTEELEGTPWEQHVDKESGGIFYFNVETKETRWQHPLESNSLPHGWSKHTDPETGNVYYFNAETDETSWELPTGSDEASFGIGKEDETREAETKD